MVVEGEGEVSLLDDVKFPTRSPDKGLLSLALLGFHRVWGPWGRLEKPGWMMSRISKDLLT